MKLELKWIDCPKCEGEGGFEYGYNDDSGWARCPMCGGEGKVQQPIRVKEEHA